ncbi:MAG: Lhr family helicase, partial [Pseudonocardiaceae bacterium]
DGWIALAPTDVADLLLPDRDDAAPDLAPLQCAVLGALGWDPDGSSAAGGALFFRRLADRAGEQLVSDGEPAPIDTDVVTALWDLVWAGLVTNDSLAPLRALVSGRGAAHRPRRSAPRSRYARMRARDPLAGSSREYRRHPMPSRGGPPTAAGRWSLAPAPETDPTRRAHAHAEAFLERHGVLTRGALDTERVTGGFAAVYKVLRAMEESGRCRRGYVIEGLGGAQFAVPGAIDRLRALGSPGDRTSGQAVVLAAADPAQPYGAALPWPRTTDEVRHRPGRKAGALVVLVDGIAVLYVERGGRSLLSFTAYRDVLRAAVAALAAAVHQGWLGSLSVQRADGEAVLGSALAELLSEAGFRTTPRGLRLRA